jgi:hypothetical protein
MTKRQREILEGIEGGQTSEGNKDVHDPAEGQRFDAFVEELQGLEGYGWIELHLQKNYMTHHGEWFKASYKLTEEGRDALAHERGRG